MKRIFLVVLMFAAIAASPLFSFDEDNWYRTYPDAIARQKLQFNLGVGFGTPRYGNMVIPPLSLSGDYNLPLGGLPFTVGGLFGITTSRYKNSWAGLKYIYDYTGLVFAGRFGYHPNFGVPNLDTYANISLGYYIFSAKATYEGNWGTTSKIDPDDYSSFYFGFNLGGRYFFTPNIGAFVELGWSAFTFVTAGVTFKL